MPSGSPVERASARHRRRAVAAPAAKPASTTPVVPAKHSTVTKPSATTNARTAVSAASVPAPIINLPPSQTPTNSASSTPSQSTTPRTTAASSSPKPKSSSTSTKPKGSSSTKASSTQSAAPALSSAKDASSSTPKIVGVVVGIVAVLAIVALGIILRKWLIRRRKNKMNTWGADLQSNLERKRETYHDDVPVTSSASVVVTPPFTDKPLAPLPSEAITLPVMPAAAGVPEHPARPPSWSSAAPSSIAPSTYTTVPMAPQSPSLAGMNSVVAVDPSTPSAAVRRELCVVKRTFLPTMPDELSLTNGEHVFIVQAYDDGWAKCVNLRGSQGVVPIECLARNVDADAQHAGGDAQDGASWRLSKRASSLFAPANAPGMY